MIGNNKICLNNATMREAVQLWLDSKTLSPLAKVGPITSNNNNTEFYIELDGSES